MNDSSFHKQYTLPGVSIPKTKKDDSIPGKLPKKIGPYTIENLLDKGGMSWLYLASHPTTKEPLTIKVLSEKYVSQPEIIKRFSREADIIAMADHPNIIKIYGHGKWKSGLYIAMEFVQGVSLRQFIREETLSLKRSLEIILEVASALCHLHSLGVVHRDLKPDNILLTESGNIKLIDFGIAQMISEISQQSKTKEKKDLTGTPDYMSPEQKKSLPLSFSSDIYSLGVIAYELILGRLSKGSINLSLLPSKLRQILEKTLKTDFKHRYQDIVELIADLSNYLKSEDLKEETKQNEKYSFLKQQLAEIRLKLIPEIPPKWTKIKLGILNHRGILSAGVYHDFFALAQGQYAIVIAEPHKKDIPGLILSAILRGMIRSLAYTTKSASECIRILNELIYEDPLKEHFHLSYLQLNPADHIFHYINCGNGQLFYLPASTDQVQQLRSTNPPLGEISQSHILEIRHPWSPGDSLFMQSFDESSTKFSSLPKSLIYNELKTLSYLEPQKLADAIFRKIRLTAPSLIEDQPFALLAISRLE